MNNIRVNLKKRSYTISVEGGALRKSGHILSELREQGDIYDKIIIITNPSIDSFYGKSLTDSLNSAGFKHSVICVDEGERHKSLPQMESLCRKLVSLNADRRTTILALGGGVIGDLAGFTAASYMRGIPYIQVPTTLLSMVDSSVGGKTGVNIAEGKNLIGAFYQPKAVIIDHDTLATLPQRELMAGISEVIKYALIKDYDFFVFCENNIEYAKKLNTDVIEHMITTSCAIKAEVIEADEREECYRAILNFGHTVGHAIEALTSYSRYIHGEAVAIGMIYASELSYEFGHINREDCSRIKALIRSAGLPVTPPGLNDTDIINTIIHDKKAVDGKVKFVLLDEIGKTVFKDTIHLGILKRVWKKLSI